MMSMTTLSDNLSLVTSKLVCRCKKNSVIHETGNFDFVIATIHVVWGATVLGRREEVQKLNDLLAALQKRANTEKDLIIVGDFNLPPTDMGWQLQGWEPLIK